jgi:tetratricopeptide (TPR) repeat protein
VGFINYQCMTVGLKICKFNKTLHDALHHGVFLLSPLIFFLLGVPSALGEPPAIGKPFGEGVVQGALATPEQLLSGFRRGLFAEVAEEGTRLIASEPDAGVYGVVAVCRAAGGDMEGAAAMLGKARSTNEPSFGLHQMLFEALAARRRNESKAEKEACEKAIANDASHPVAHLLLAESAFQRKDYAFALEQTEKALELEPRMALAFLVRGLVFRAQQEVPAAMKAFTNAMTLDPRDLRPRVAIAETAFAVANYSLAAQVYREILSLNPAMGSEVRERFLQCLIETDQMEEASKVAAALLADKPTSATGHLGAGRAAAWLNRRPEAVRHFAEFEKLAPENKGLASYLIGLCELADGRTAEACTAFERSATSASLKSNAMAALGVALHQQGKREAAAKALNEALPGAFVGLAQRIHFHLGLICLDEKDWAGAKQHFTDSDSFVANLEIGSIDLESIYGKSPENSLAPTSLGVLFTAEKMPSAASPAFRKSCQINDRNVLALLLDSNLYALQLNFDEASQQLAEVSRILENYWPASFAAGSIEMSRRDYDKAIPYFIKALKNAPGNKNVHVRLIALYLLTNQNEEAEAACLEMIERLPDSPVGYNELAGLMITRGDPASLASAEELATKAVSLEPKNGLYLDTLGWVKFKQGKTDIALEALRRATDLESGNPEVQYHFGAALLKVGNKLEAATHLKLAVIGGAGSVVAREAAALLKQIPPKDGGGDLGSPKAE